MNDFLTPNFSLDLSDQVALVTGTTSGLGRRFAQVLAKCGAKVILTGRRVEKLNDLAEEIRAQGGVCEPFPMDMTDRESIRSVLASAEKKLGLITILVNNAGIPDAERATKMSDELIDNVFDTNLVGPYILSCEIARRLIAEKRPGRMVNISSIAAFDTRPGSAVALYSTTKAGIVRMTEALAVEWAGFNINVNGIAPGAFSSEMMDGMLERVGDISRGFPRKRICQPEQMDSTLLFLLSPSSECVTGTIIKVDDGQSAR
ncbi:MAG: NAD(P)-dependent dehydrogenase (short-subunit alcohol dehydrogenase family) [Oceanicoccus sp.]|jgi:NAD(P)-dependent dehydrogenase (short-subunit alcohol dehydrogenase family)